MDQRRKFVEEYERGLEGMAELCRQHEISRETGYKWVKRRQLQGWEGLEDLSRAPERHPNQTASQVEERILDLRREHPRWGARKLRAYLGERSRRRKWPAASTIGDLLKREGLIIPRKLRRKTPPYTQPFADAIPFIHPAKRSWDQGRRRAGPAKNSPASQSPSAWR